MGRFWKEIQYFWEQVRGAYPRQKDMNRYYEVVKPILCLELQSYTYLDCLKAVVTCGVPVEWQGRLAHSLYCRSNRGYIDMLTIKTILQNRLTMEERNHHERDERAKNNLRRYDKKADDTWIELYTAYKKSTGKRKDSVEEEEFKWEGE